MRAVSKKHGPGPWSNTSRFLTSAGRPGCPSAFRVGGTTHSMAILEWKRPERHGGATITHYAITVLESTTNTKSQREKANRVDGSKRCIYVASLDCAVGEKLIKKKQNDPVSLPTAHLPLPIPQASPNKLKFILSKVSFCCFFFSIHACLFSQRNLSLTPSTLLMPLIVI